MSGELCLLYIETIASFLPGYQHVYDLVLFHDIIQNAIVTQAKFPGRDWIGS
jgi:hypothetical protein